MEPICYSCSAELLSGIESLSYAEGLQVVDREVVSEQVEESILEHASVTVPVADQYGPRLCNATPWDCPAQNGRERNSAHQGGIPEE